MASPTPPGPAFQQEWMLPDGDKVLSTEWFVLLQKEQFVRIPEGGSLHGFQKEK